MPETISVLEILNARRSKLSTYIFSTILLPTHVVLLLILMVSLLNCRTATLANDSPALLIISHNRGRFVGLFVAGRRRGGRDAELGGGVYILATDVAVRHVLEMIARVITRDIGGRDLVQFYAPMHHHVAVNSPIAGRNLLLKNAYGGRRPAPPHKIEPITPNARPRTFCGTGKTHRLSRAMPRYRMHARARARAEIHVHRRQ